MTDELHMRRILYEAASQGYVEVNEHNGEAVFRLTGSGTDRVHEIVDDYLVNHGEDAEQCFAETMGIPVEAAQIIIDKSLEQRGLTRPD